MVDGLGHGEHAETAARAAVDYVAAHLSERLPNLFAGCASAISHTRGVAMGIAVIDEDAGTMSYGGIGNTRVMIVGENTTRLSSNYGIVGGGYRALTPETVPLVPDDLVILFTDGLPETVDTSGYDDGVLGDTQRLAERILQDWGRESDDAAVLVFRNEQG